MTIQEYFRRDPIVAVAFSGGVDSAWLLHEALQYAQRTRAYFVRTPFQPAFELADARATAEQLGAELTVIDFDILTLPEVTANPHDRCYHCKKALFTLIAARAMADGFPLVADGSNASDDAGDRPGMVALRELGVVSPLRQCGITKADIRSMSRQAGIPLWDKPSYACLATRVPTGTAITLPDLHRVERGEQLLMDAGFTDFRLRLRGSRGLLQVRREEMARARVQLPALASLLAEDFEDILLDDTPRASRET